MFIVLDPIESPVTMEGRFRKLSIDNPTQNLFGLVSENDQVVGMLSKFTHIPVDRLRATFGEEKWRLCRCPGVISKLNIQQKPTEVVYSTNIKNMRGIKKDDFILILHPKYLYDEMRLMTLETMAKRILQQYPLVHHSGVIHAIKLSALDRYNVSFIQPNLFSFYSGVYQDKWAAMKLPWNPLIQNEENNLLE